MNTQNLVDVLNALPTSKLISTVSAGIGRLYEPTHIKRMAKAKAEEIKLISGAMEDGATIPTQYCNGDLSMSTLDWEDFAKRTQGRLAFQELRKQNNIECVVSNAYNILETRSSCSEEPVDSDWICSFFNFVANVSSEEMQILWGKLLAEEITQPGCCSIRTLDVLRKLTHKEATLFKKIMRYTLKCWGDEAKTFKDYFLISDSLEYMNIKFPDILKMADSGLLIVASSIYTEIIIPPNDENTLEGINKIIKFYNNGDTNVHIQNRAYLLTEAGKELYDVMNDFDIEYPEPEYFNNCVKLISTPNYVDEKKWTKFVTTEIVDKINIGV